MQKLKNILLVNALSSGFSGLLLAIMPGAIAGVFGVVHSWPFLATGVFLLLFALLVYYTFSKKKPDRTWVKIIIALDTFWVAASLIIVGLQLFNLSLWGYVLITGIAAWVAAMAYLQQLGLRKTQLGAAE